MSNVEYRTQNYEVEKHKSLVALEALIFRGMFFFSGVFLAFTVAFKTLGIFCKACMRFINGSWNDLLQ